MADEGWPAPESSPPGRAVSLEFSVSDRSTSSTNAITSSTLSQSVHTHWKEAMDDICEEQSDTLPLKDITCSNVAVNTEPAEQPQGPPKPSGSPTSSRSPHTLSQGAVTEMKTSSAASLPFLPIHRCHSDTLAPVNQSVEPATPNCMQEMYGMLACKQPMQLQQCSIVTAICSGEGVAPLPPSRCACISPVEARIRIDCSANNLPPKCDKTICYSSYVQNANFEDTFAAYCHPQPIPAPSQLLPRLASIQPTCNAQRAAASPPATSHLSLPRLISSVSETGLDAKHLPHCCNLNCTWINAPPPGSSPQFQKLRACCGSPTGQVRIMTKDMGTMTTNKVLKDIGVQTSQTVGSHVFPQICLVEESKSENSARKTPKIDRTKKHGGAPKSPVKEVKWDAEGMTWEVYGASVDPEELGLAIQKHLELQIKETASRAAKLSRQNTNTSQQVSSQRKKSRVMGSFRTPGCCSRSTTAVD